VTDATQQCGLIAIVGRPNVGKSTLLNYLLGQKISITSRKPQTTRHQVMGIKTTGASQMIFVDTPGIHKSEARAINRVMNRAASSAISDVDLVLFVVDRDRWTDEDELVLSHLKRSAVPTALLINKVDLLSDPNTLLPLVSTMLQRHSFVAVLPISALRHRELDTLENLIQQHLPTGPHLFPEDQITDRSERFLVAELIREKIIRQLGDELPYATAVEIESFEVQGGIVHIHALILVERAGQKKILIGERGSRLRSIGTQARVDMETLLGQKVMLKLWVKVKSGWSDDLRALRSLGLDESGRT